MDYLISIVAVLFATGCLSNSQSDFEAFRQKWSSSFETNLNGFAYAESPFRPTHHPTKITSIKGSPIGFFCISPFEVAAINLENGTMLWRRILDVNSNSESFYDQCHLGYCSGIDISIDMSKSATCQVQVFAISPKVKLFALNGENGRYCQTPTQLFSQTSVSESPLSQYGVSVPPIIVKKSVIVAMDTVRASNIRGGYLEIRSIVRNETRNISIVLLRKRFGSAFKTPMIYSKKLDLLFVVISPVSTPTSSIAEDRFANSILALRVKDLSIAWSYKFLHLDEYFFEYRQPPLLTEIVESNGRKITSLFVLSPFGNIYWLNAATGYEKYHAFVRPLPPDGNQDSNSESNNWIRLNSGTLGNIFSDFLYTDDNKKFSRFPQLDFEDGIIRMSSPGIVSGGMTVDSQKSRLFVSFVQSMLFLEPPSASTETKGKCSAASNHISGCAVKPLGVPLCPLSCESGFIDFELESNGQSWCANVSETGVTAIFLNNTVAWSFALNPFLPTTNLFSMPLLLNIRAFDILWRDGIPGRSNDSIWLIDPFSRSILTANAENGEIEAAESDIIINDDVVHFAKFQEFEDDLSTWPSLKDSAILFSEGHSWTAIPGRGQFPIDSFRITLLHIPHNGSIGSRKCTLKQALFMAFHIFYSFYSSFFV